MAVVARGDFRTVSRDPVLELDGREMIAVLAHPEFREGALLLDNGRSSPSPRAEQSMPYLYGMGGPDMRRPSHLRAVPTSPEELRAFIDEIDDLADHATSRSDSSRRRRDVAGYQLRIDLAGVTPAIWRRIVVPSNLRLDELHPLLQAAMGWGDCHLHEWVRVNPQRPGGRETYAMRSSIEDSFVEEGDDFCEEDIRLDEALAEPGDTLRYVYDFGDGWEHTIILEAIAEDAAPGAVACLAGERSCPPEDCGGVRGYEHLLEVLDDPMHPEHEELREWAGPDFAPEAFDLDAANAALRRRDALRRNPPVFDSQLAELLTRVPYRAAPLLYSLISRAELQGGVGPDFDHVQASALAHLRWLLHRIGPDGITLTASGYLPPADVEAARNELDWGGNRIGTSTREVDNPQVQFLREAGRAFGLTRKLKGRLLLTKLGVRMLRSDGDLWAHVVTTLPLGKERVEQEAGRILLLTVAAGASSNERRAVMVEALTVLGWRNSDGTPLSASDAGWAADPTRQFLRTIGALVDNYGQPDAPADPAWARVFARMALSM
ncbi:plasmid pRiA4b ORF-3 family protein [Rhodococcus daqingensis]|uniref:Plasmid pRiA4b ORF-3 family protein n=1 Tax=Rhodococcus daqingensis TaxID=2479363 RepID=A0ABW2S1P9_9NOCA